jgi:hypothetical protein
MKRKHRGSFWFCEALFEETARSWFQSQFVVFGALILRVGLLGKYIRAGGIDKRLGFGNRPVKMVA